MDLSTQEILKIFHSHSRVKKIITTICYFFIAAGVAIYIFHALSQSRTIKLINKYKDGEEIRKVEKVMTNPRIKFQYNEGDIYDIRAKTAIHKDKDEAVLYDVFAEGKIGKITAGKLDVKSSGDHLIFSDNPVLILNKTNQ